MLSNSTSQTHPPLLYLKHGDGTWCNPHLPSHSSGNQARDQHLLVLWEGIVEAEISQCHVEWILNRLTFLW